MKDEFVSKKNMESLVKNANINVLKNKKRNQESEYRIYNEYTYNRVIKKCKR